MSFTPPLTLTGVFMHLGSYIMRNARMAEITKILSFYKTNRNKNNAVREDEQLIETIDDKKLFIVVDKDTNNIEAASGTFGYEDGEYMEAGATFVSPHLRGFRIGLVFLWVSFLNEELLDPNFARFFAVVRPDNVASIKNLEAAGFFATSPDGAVRQLKDLTERRYYVLPRSSRHQHARALLAAEADPCRKRKNGDTIVMDLSVEILGPDWRTMVCALSAHRR